MKVWKVILAALVLFLAGVVSGALADQLYRVKTRHPAAALPDGPPAPWLRQRVEFMHHLGSRLSLAPGGSALTSIVKNCRCCSK